MNNITIYSYISPLGLYWFRMRKYFIYEQRSTADFTCAILCGDGYLDTIADVRAGFKPIWGSEIYEQRQVFTDLTNGDDLSDTIRSTMKVRIGFTMSNQDSLAQINSSNGDHNGARGKYGWIYAVQVAVLFFGSTWIELSVSETIVMRQMYYNGDEITEIRERRYAKYIAYTVGYSRYGTIVFNLIVRGYSWLDFWGKRVKSYTTS